MKWHKQPDGSFQHGDYPVSIVKRLHGYQVRYAQRGWKRFESPAGNDIFSLNVAFRWALFVIKEILREARVS